MSRLGDGNNRVVVSSQFFQNTLLLIDILHCEGMFQAFSCPRLERSLASVGRNCPSIGPPPANRPQTARFAKLSRDWGEICDSRGSGRGPAQFRNLGGVVFRIVTPNPGVFAKFALDLRISPRFAGVRKSRTGSLFQRHRRMWSCPNG